MKGFDFMKKILAAVIAITAIGMTACGNSSDDKGAASNSRVKRTDIVSSVDSVSESGSEDISDITSENSVEEVSESISEQNAQNNSETEQEENKSSKILIAYFSLGENNGLSGDVDADAGASVKTVNGYVSGNTGVIADYIRQATGGDMFSILTEYYYPESYDETLNVAQQEIENDEHPGLASHIDDLDKYDTVFIGFPNWWYGLPAPMDSFFEEYDFSGKTIIPFVTSGGSGFSDSIDNIRNYEPNANILDGLAIYYTDVEGAQSEVNDWISGLGL